MVAVHAVLSSYYSPLESTASRLQPRLQTRDQEPLVALPTGAWLTVGQWFDVKVTRVESPSEIWLQNLAIAGHRSTYADHPSCTAFALLMHKMNAYYSDTANLVQVPRDEVLVQRVMCACEEDEVTWHRVQVQSLTETDSVTVLLIDHGSRRTFPLKRLQLLPQALRGVRRQAVRAALHGLSPSFPLDSASDLMRQLLLHKPLVAHIMAVEDGVLHVGLTDTSGQKDVCMASILSQRLSQANTSGAGTA